MAMKQMPIEGQDFTQAPMGLRLKQRAPAMGPDAEYDLLQQ